MAEKCFSFVSESDIAKVRENRTPVNTKKHPLLSSNVYKMWENARNKVFAHAC